MSDENWLRAFHRGDREAMTRCYEEYQPTVTWAVGQVLPGVDRETMVQEVFCRLFDSEELRRNFTGGNLGAWLVTVARRRAIDFRRHRDREQPTDDRELARADREAVFHPDETLELRALVDRFRRVLPPKWEPVFRTRFLEQRPQREAAQSLGMRRTTLAYQELQIRRLLRRFVLEEDS